MHIRKEDFAHLHVHSYYSFLDGMSSPKQIIDRVIENGQKAVAITDHGNMHGVIEFFDKAKEQGIKPIIGCEVYVAPGSMKDKAGEAFKGEGGKNYYHLILLAETQEGYQNLMKIVSTGWTEGYYYKPRVDKDVLREHSKGIIATSACLGSSVLQLMMGDNFDGVVTEDNYVRAKNEAMEYVDIFGKENFYIELQNHGLLEQDVTNPMLEKIAEELGLKCIVANDAHYAKQEDAKAHQIMLCIQTGAKITDQDKFAFPTDEFYLKSTEEMLEAFPGKEEYLKNTMEIVNRCNVDLSFDGFKMPKIDVPEEFEGNHNGYLKQLLIEGRNKLFTRETWSKEHQERLKEELHVITSMNFTDYFLIVADYVRWAKDNGIYVGFGRGSASGSLLCYLLGITSHIDPLEYSLLFSRFLNEERKSLPDIDSDFQKSRRDEVKEYVRQKYGEERTCDIVTFGTMGAKSAFKDVARVFDIPFTIANKVTKLIGSDLGITLEEAFNNSKELSEMIQQDPKLEEAWSIAVQLEGKPRQVGVHASGVLITPEDIDKYAPVMTIKGKNVVQFPMEIVDRVGLVKMDFLGLATLDAVDFAVQAIRETKNKDFVIDDVSFDDKDTYDMLNKGHTEAVFQFESSGMTKTMTQLKPRDIEGLSALTSIYRPGPMQFIPEYVQNKENPGTHNLGINNEDLLQILKPTYYVPLYQEQIMQIFQRLAGFTPSQADDVRKAMGKKKMDVLEKNFKYFKYGIRDEKGNLIPDAKGRVIPGALEKGITEAQADNLLEKLTEFGRYAFNKSHGISYSILSYQTAYLRTHFPAEFMAATMSAYIDNNDKLAYYVGVSSKKVGVNIISPDINKSTDRFKAINDKEILFAFNGIKSVGGKVARKIMEERSVNGEFISLYNFISRMNKHNDVNIGESVCATLIKVGAFDSFGYSRNSLLSVLPKYFAIAKNAALQKSRGLQSIFALLSDEVAEEISMPKIEELPDSNQDIMKWEKDLCALYISVDPLEGFLDNAKYEERIYDIRDVIEGYQDGDYSFQLGSRVCFMAMLDDMNPMQTKTGKLMARPLFEDRSNQIQGIIFPNDFEEVSKFLNIKTQPQVLVEGTISQQSDEYPEIIVSRIASLASDAELREHGVNPDMLDKYEGFSFSRRASISKSMVKAGQDHTMSLSRKVLEERGLFLNFENLDADIQKDVVALLKEIPNGELDVYIVKNGKALKLQKRIALSKEYEQKIFSLLREDNNRITVKL